MTLPGLELLEPTASKRSRRAAVTFEGGLDAPFHRWFRLTPSFSPDLVRGWLSKYGITPGQTVLEPFAGAGTTNIVAKELGIDSIGVEINPFLAFVGQTSVDWTPTAQQLRDASARVVATARESVLRGPHDPEAFAAFLGDSLPPIHNVSRWWRDQVLRELVAVRHAINQQDAALANHLKLALAQIVYSTANITLGRLQVAFVNRSHHEIHVFEPFSQMVEKMAADLGISDDFPTATATIHNADSTILDFVEDGSIDAVFTSPPYPNRYSYVWNTRPHLYLLEFISTSKEAAALDMQTIGGTWGSATSRLMKGVVEPRPIVEKAAGAVIERLHEESTLMGNYVTKYFNSMDIQVGAVRPKLRDGAHVGYVVGNSESKGIMVETHEILGEIFLANGFDQVEQDVLRKRNSGVGLTEVTVSARASN
ncbi:DNA methyltransferase [Microbacterium terregens]|uniref:site-specific DNA-methyltransferase (cytosine-N(4)-specific) n=1 Tax=Microbacterium terregens TaxID=69363 RepID=A0ABV5SVZ6_9MICO